jgi:putative heme-binding domain-containing protein
MSPISDFDKLQFASAMGRMPKEERMNMAFALLGLDYQATTDRPLQLMVWYSLESVITDDPDKSLKLASQIQMPLVRQFIVRRLLSEDPSLVNAVIRFSTRSSAVGTQAGMLRGILDVDIGSDFNITKNSKRRLFAFNKSNDKQLRHVSQIVAVRLGFDALRRELWKTIADTEAPSSFRVEAVKTLGYKPLGSDHLRFLQLLQDELLAEVAIDVLGESSNPAIAIEVLNHFDTLTRHNKYLAIDLMTSRPNWTLELFDQINADKISPDFVRPLALERLRNMKIAEIDEQIAKHWPLARPVSGDKQSQIKKYKAILGEDASVYGDARIGNKIFTRVCGQCHKMYGQGGTIGPDLTGSGRHDLDYILQNVVDPSAVVAKNYRATSIETQDGKILSGIVLRRTDRVIELQMAEKVIQIKSDEIAEETPSTKSIMPDGLFDQLDETQLRDLIAFLFSNAP